MATKLNKNGIPVLDPPGVNHLKRKQRCLPGEHKFELKREYRDLGNFRDVEEFACRFCDESDVRYTAHREAWEG